MINVNNLGFPTKRISGYKLNVAPKEIQIVNNVGILTATINHINIIFTELVPNSHAVAKVTLFNSNNTIIKIETIRIDGEAYENWGTSDEEIVSDILLRLELESLV